MDSSIKTNLISSGTWQVQWDMERPSRFRPEAAAVAYIGLVLDLAY